jgi:PleD family two-component response regulator
MTDEDQQALVYKLAEDIMMVIAGREMEIAQSAMTLAVVAMIVVAAEKEEALRPQLLAGLVKAVRGYLARQDIVDWIEASIVPKGKLQ